MIGRVEGSWAFVVDTALFDVRLNNAVDGICAIRGIGSLPLTLSKPGTVLVSRIAFAFRSRYSLEEFLGVRGILDTYNASPAVYHLAHRFDKHRQRHVYE